MRLTRSVLTIVFSLGFLVAQLPATASCQMGFFSALTMRCSMPCCKKIPSPSCPMVKQAEPRDTISPSPLIFDFSAQNNPLLPVWQTLFQNVRYRFHQIRQGLTPSAFLKRPPPSRAPPSSVVTFQA